MQLNETFVIPTGRKGWGDAKQKMQKVRGFGTQVMPLVFNASKITISLFCEQ